ncbi:MAG: response regulator [Candidatus Latescibacteria bacterium]|nr:response regulator [Candidatus Latescibacterota bacterium]
MSTLSYTRLNAALRLCSWAGEALQQSPDEVERRVQERTAELASVNEALRRELAERARAEEQLKAECAQLEAQLLQAQKMEIVGQLASGAAHDFNNLLMVILGYADLLLLRLDASSPMRKSLEEIKRASNRAAALTRQLLTFSRKQVLHPQVLDLNTVMTDIDKMLRRLIDEQITLITVPDSALDRVKADPGQIEQVIMNLVVNARDAMPEGGVLTIETANVELDQEYARWHANVQPGPYVMLAVSDTGCGMDEATQARIFEPFFTTKEPGKGTGLGLSTVASIIKQSGGCVWVYSEVGRGTTFKIYLPRVEEAVEVRSKDDSSSAVPRGTETVLVVEDDSLVRELAVQILQEQGYTVLEASNGREALLTGQEHVGSGIDLLLTDLVMPQMSGREVAEYLACVHPNIRILYMSGYTDRTIIQHNILEAGTSLLQKPFTPNVMIRKVREVLDAPLGNKDTYPSEHQRSLLRWPAER